MISINTNDLALGTGLNLNRAQNLNRLSIQRLSSGLKINSAVDDAAGLAVGTKLQGRLNRIAAFKQNILAAKSFTEVQFGALRNASDVLSRMSQLKTMSSDVSKNEQDLENYNKEFIELQLHLEQITKHKFNDISLFTSPKIINHFLHAQLSDASNADRYINLARNFLKGQFVSASGSVLAEPIIEQTSTTKTTTANVVIQTSAGATGVNALGNEVGVGNPELNWSVTGPLSVVNQVAPNPAWVSDASIKGNWIGAGNGPGGVYLYSMPFDLTGVDLNNVKITGNVATDDGGRILINGQAVGINTGFKNLRSFSLEADDSQMIVNGGTSIPNMLTSGNNQFTVRVSNSMGLTGFTPTGLLVDDLKIEATKTTSTTEIITTVTDDYPDLSEFEQTDFTRFLEDIADAIAILGAEQSRLEKESMLNDLNFSNLEAARSRIMDIDVAVESSNYAKSNVKVQSSSTMVAKANKLHSEIAMRLMVNR